MRRHPEVHLVVPEAVGDPSRPSGGNVYDRRVTHELARLGWHVAEHLAGGSWPRPSEAALAELDATLARLPAGSAVVVDGLVGSAAPDVLLRHADRLDLVPLVHLPFGVDDPGQQPTEKAVLSAARAVVVTSDWCRGWVLQQYGLAEGSVAVARPGVDRAPLARPTDDGSRLLCVGALSVLKGQDVLVEAVTQLADLPWTLRFVGSPQVEPELAGQLRRRVAERGLAGRVTFTGALPTDALAAAYAEADLLVLPSRRETYAMVVTEALARGLPVIGSDTGGVAEALDAAGRRPGLLVAPDDPDRLAEALRGWLADPGLRTGLRAAAWARREGLVGWPATARRLALVLEGVRMRRDRWRWLRLVGGAGVIALLLWRLGTGPVVAALRALDVRLLVLAVLATAFTTLCCAWRWQQVARRFGLRIGLAEAVGAYYRSQLLNATLPGGVLGDVHRAVRQGADAGSLQGGLRSVAWERLLGQLAQGLLVLVAFWLLPMSLRLPVLVVIVVGALTVGLVVVASRSWGRLPLDDVRQLLARPRVLLASMLASLAAAATHGVLFALAAQAAGVGAPLWRLLPLALLVLTASALPLNLAGWGPREGASAWVFAAGGLSASEGLTVSVLYGALVLVATLPGLVVIAMAARGRRRAHA